MAWRLNLARVIHADPSQNRAVSMSRQTRNKNGARLLVERDGRRCLIAYVENLTAARDAQERRDSMFEVLRSKL